MPQDRPPIQGAPRVRLAKLQRDVAMMEVALEDPHVLMHLLRRVAYRGQPSEVLLDWAHTSWALLRRRRPRA